VPQCPFHSLYLPGVFNGVRAWPVWWRLLVAAVWEENFLFLFQQNTAKIKEEVETPFITNLKTTSKKIIFIVYV
jgi:hypothetical protein